MRIKNIQYNPYGRIAEIPAYLSFYEREHQS